jgi:hypothetical protein
MLLRRIGIAAGAIALTTAGLAGPASAGGTSPSTFAKVIGPTIIDRHDPRVGHLAAIYRCSGEGTLWVSVKQTADRKADPALREEGSSAIAAAWSDSHSNPVNCDGHVHIGTFTVNQEEPVFGQTDPKSSVYGPLARGKGYVQFCLFDANHTDEPVSDMTFHFVI